MLEAFEGKAPQIAPDAFVHRAAVLIGEVIIGSQASVWPNVTLRGDDGAIVVGNKTSVQDGTTIHCTEGWSKTTIGARVTIGHNVILHGCTIGDETLIGIGSIILNGAKIGKNCIIGANSLIPEGKEIPDNSLVMGAPGKVVKQVSDHQIQVIKMSAVHYVENWKRHKSGLKRID